MIWTKWLRRGALFVTLIFMMIIGGYWGAVHWLDFNRYKPQIEQLAQQQLGMPIHIQGEITAQAFPLAVQFHQVKAQQPGRQLQIQQVAIDLSLWHLFTQRKLALTAVHIIAPKITQSWGEEGAKVSFYPASGAALGGKKHLTSVANDLTRVFGSGWQWQMASVTTATSMHLTSPWQKVSQWLADGRLAQFHVEQGEMTLKASDGRVIRQFKHIDFLALDAQWDHAFPFTLDIEEVQPTSSASDALQQNLHLEGKMQWSRDGSKGILTALQGVSESSIGELAPLRVQLACKSMQWHQPSQTLRWQQLRLSALDGALISSGESHYGAHPEWLGQLHLNHFNLQEWARHTGVILPNFVHKQALTELSGQFQWRLTPQSWLIKKMSLQWDDSHVQGEIWQQQTDAFSPLQLNFDLKVDKLNLEHYRAYAHLHAMKPTQNASTENTVKKSEKNAKIPRPEGGKALSFQEGTQATADQEAFYLPLAVPVSTLRALEAHGHLQIGQLSVKGMTLKVIDTTVDLKKGRMLLAPLDAQLYGGVWQSKFWLDVNGETPAYGWQGNVKQVNLTQLLQATQTPWALKGTLNSRYRLQSQGSNREAILGHLKGHLRLKLVKGALLGGDVNRLIAGKKLTAPNAETYFNQLLVEGPVLAGIYHAKTIQLKAPRFQAMGYGRLNLLKETMALNLRAQLVNPPKAEYAQAVLPIKIEGSWQKPQWSVPLKPLLESPENRKVIVTTQPPL